MNVESPPPAPPRLEEIERVSHVKRAIELDFLRGIAILLVLVAHFSPGFGGSLHLAYFGGGGVNLFFVLSGFLVGGLLLREWNNTGKINGVLFLKRRALKIWPAYYFYVLSAWALHEHPLNTFLVGNLLNIQNYVGTSLDQTWSLAVEEHFYLLLTFFLVFACWRRIAPKTVIIICLAVAFTVTAVRIISYSYYGWPAMFYTHTRIDSLLFGVILATLLDFFPDHFRSLQQHRLLLVVGFVLCLAGMCLMEYLNRRDIEVFWTDVAAAALLLLAFRPVTNLNRGWFYRMIALIGIYSYGIYLWHRAVWGEIKSLEVRFHINAPWLMDIVPYIGAIILGVIMTKLIEFPFLRLRELIAPSPHGSHLLSSAPRKS